MAAAQHSIRRGSGLAGTSDKLGSAHAIGARDPNSAVLMHRQRSFFGRRSGGAGPVPKSFYHQGVEAKLRERFASARIVLGAAGQTVAAQAVGQRGQKRALAEPLAPF